MNDFVWMHSARELVQQLGYVDAKRKCTQWRDASTEGTATHAFHNAVLKHVRLLEAREKVDIAVAAGSVSRGS